MSTPYIQQMQNRVYSAAIKAGATKVFAELVTSQAKHESGNFSSRLFKLDNNTYGMKIPSKRKTPYIIGKGIAAPVSEGKTPYAKYATVEDSVFDLFNWLAYNKVNIQAIDSATKYAEILKSKGYYGDTLTNYVSALVRHLSAITGKLIEVSGNGSGLVLLFIILLILFI